MLYDKIQYYKDRLVVLIETLESDPESVLEPSRLHVSSSISKSVDLEYLHSVIVKVSQDLYVDGHYADAVFNAFKSVNSRVKAHYKKIKGSELDGTELMMKSFGDKAPAIVMGDISTDTGRSMQEGYKFIFAGSMQAIRNPKAHDMIKIDKKRALHFLFLASLEMYKLDEASIEK